VDGPFDDPGEVGETLWVPGYTGGPGSLPGSLDV
jgi:hypothetical protein